MLKRSVIVVWHRMPLPLRNAVLRLRGIFWKRQLKGELKNRNVPSRIKPVSVVIPSYNDVPLLRKCLKSLRETLQTSDEIIVVDDFCEPQNSRLLKELASAFTNVRVIFKSERLGFAGTVNLGMQEAQHDIILLNSDIVALPGWVEFLQAASTELDDRSIISPKLLYPDCRIQYGGTFWSRSFAPQWFAHRFAGRKFNFPPSNLRLPNWGASGAALYIPRNIYESLGGLDPDYWLGFEDVDYAMKAWTQGKSSVYEPNAMLFHLESATRGKHQGNREFGSMRRFWNKWNYLHAGRIIDAHHIHLAFEVTDPTFLKDFIHTCEKTLRSLGISVSTGGDITNVPPTAVTLDFSQSLTTEIWHHHALMGLPIKVLAENPRPIDDESNAFFMPEFDYIAFSETEAAQFRAATNWPTLGSVSPFSGIVSSSNQGENIIVFCDSRSKTLASTLAFPGHTTRVVEVDQIRESHVNDLDVDETGVVVNLAEAESELVFAALFECAIPLITRPTSRGNQYFRDGLNGFVVELDQAAIEERVNGMLTNDQHRAEIRRHVHQTVEAHISQLALTINTMVMTAINRRRLS